VSAASRWREALEAWSIPENILSQASQSPWIHPPELFDVPDTIPISPSHDRAREALGDDASALDIGCGGGVATYALVPHIRKGVGVDHQVEMLSMYARNGIRFGVDVETIEGFWPEVAPQAPVCDVAVAHHVAYNVPDIVPFLLALNDHARFRVMLELPTAHPLSNMSAAWQYFWGLERPSGPSPLDLIEVVGEMGFAPHLETWHGAARVDPSFDQAARFMRVRLCLPPERETEVRDFLANQEPVAERALAAVWWNVTSEACSSDGAHLHGSH
jgi:SAM-dependent methyltransferase